MGNVSITFSIYDVATVGTALWSETQGSVDVNDGLFQVTLGSVTTLLEGLFDGSERWIGINVAGDGEMSPRTKIVSVPYALYARGIGGNDGNVDIGTEDNPAILHIFGETHQYDPNADITRMSRGVYPTEFKGASYGTPSEVEWDFDDGATNTTSMTPAHNYTSPISLVPSCNHVNIGKPDSPERELYRGSQLDVFGPVVAYAAELPYATDPAPPGYPDKYIKLLSYPEYGELRAGLSQHLVLTPDSTRLVGIGTINPTEYLDVNGTVRVRSLPDDIEYDDVVVVDEDGVLHTRDVNTLTSIGEVESTGSVNIGADTDLDGDGEIMFQTADTTRVTITNDGNVDIGTNTSSTTLRIHNGEAKIIQDLTDAFVFHGIYPVEFPGASRDDEFAGAILVSDSLDFFIGNKSGESLSSDFFIESVTGNVGIGTTSTTERLDVDGTVRVRSLPDDIEYDNVVVVDEDGVLHTRDVNTLPIGGADDDWYEAGGTPPDNIDDDIYTYGNVGFGTTPHSYYLGHFQDINGSSTSNVYIAGPTLSYPNASTTCTIGQISGGGRSMLGVNIPWGNMTAGDESSIGLYSAAQFDMSGLDDPAVGGIFRGDNLKTDAPEVGVYGWVPAGNSFFSAGVVGVTHGTDTNNYGVYGCNKGGGSAWAGYFEGNVYTTGNVGIGITNPKSKLQVDGGVQVGNDEDTASADKVGTIRYRVSGTTSYAEMCMQTGASAFAWIVITSQSW